jgi:hypothetical protein
MWDRTDRAACWATRPTAQTRRGLRVDDHRVAGAPRGRAGPDVRVLPNACAALQGADRTPKRLSGRLHGGVIGLSCGLHLRPKTLRATSVCCRACWQAARSVLPRLLGSLDRNKLAADLSPVQHGPRSPPPIPVRSGLRSRARCWSPCSSARSHCRLRADECREDAHQQNEQDDEDEPQRPPAHEHLPHAEIGAPWVWVGRHRRSVSLEPGRGGRTAPRQRRQPLSPACVAAPLFSG